MELATVLVDAVIIVVVETVGKWTGGVFSVVFAVLVDCTCTEIFGGEKIPHESGFHQAADAIEGVNATNANIRKYFFINSSGV